MSQWISWAEGPDAIVRDLLHLGLACGMDPDEALNAAEGSVVGPLPRHSYVDEIRA
jgi:hypothetical protein